MKNNFKAYYGKIAAISLLLIFFAASWFLVLPYIVNTLEKIQIRKELKERVSLISNWEDRFKLLEEQNNELISSISKIESQSLKPDESFLITKKIYESAERYQIDIQQVEPGLLANNASEVKQEIEINLKGDYHRIARFIESLEKSEFNITIQNFELQQSNPTPFVEGSIWLSIKYKLES